MANGTVLADSIADIPHLAAFDAMVAQRLAAVQLDALLVYVIDTVSASALPHLARQFDVLGYKGYKLATNDAERRQIIKQAIELKRYMGTAWAVKEAMRSVGYGGATLTEGVPSDPPQPATDWARFRVEAVLGETTSLDTAANSELAALIREYKNVRSHLVDISYKMEFTDVLPVPSDIFDIGFETPPESDTLAWIARFADGTYFADGSINANEGNDDINITIINV